MTDMGENERRRMIDDLGRHAAADMQALLNRHMRVIEHALDAPDRMLVLLNIANGVALGAGLYAMQCTSEGNDPEELLRITGETLPKLFEIGKPMLLAEFAKRGRAPATRDAEA